MKRISSVAAFLLALPFACSADEPSSPEPSVAACAEGHAVGDACVGVPSGPLCEGTGCAPAECSSVTVVTDDPSLTQAIDDAPDGGCIVLAPGHYSGVFIPAKRLGIYGESPDTTEVASVTVSGSELATCSGFSTGSISVESGNILVIATRIVDSFSDSIYVAAGGSAKVERSEILRAGRYAVSAFDATIDVTTTIIEDPAGPGVWAQCANGCDCPSPLYANISDTVVRGSAIVGVSLVGVRGTIDNIEVSGTTVGNNFEAGGGVSIAHCSDVIATDMDIEDSADFGLLVHDSALDLNGGVIAGNLRGVWVQNVGQSFAASVSIRNASVTRNQGVGVGVDGGSSDVLLADSTIDDTESVSLPVLVGGVSAGAAEVGDGIAWKALSSMAIERVAVSGSSRASVLIDGAVGSGSSIADLVLAGGDETKGILQQSLPQGGNEPITSGTTPPVTPSTDEQLPVPTSVAAPPGI